MKNPDTTNDGALKKSYSNSQNKDKNFSLPNEKLKPFANELHLEIYPIADIIEEALKQWYFLKDKVLPKSYSYYVQQKEKGYCSEKKLAELFERCENIEHAINLQLWLITLVQKYLPELTKLNNAEKQAKEEWGAIPEKYTLIFDYNFLETKINATLYRHGK